MVDEVRAWVQIDEAKIPRVRPSAEGDDLFGL